MSLVAVKQIAAEHFPDVREQIETRYGELSTLANSNLRTQDFFANATQLVGQVFGATAAALWFWDVNRQQPQLTAQWNYGNLGLTQNLHAAHLALISFAMRKNKSLVIKPNAAPQARSSVSNPTDSMILTSPLRSGQENVGVVELFLGPLPVRGTKPAQRQAYLLLLEALTALIVHGLDLRVRNSLLHQAAHGATSPTDMPMTQLDAVEAEISKHYDAIRLALENTVLGLAGWTSPSLRDKQRVATRIHQLLDKHGLRVACPTCGEPAILRCQSAGNAKSGVFLFDHYLESGRTFHGGTSELPPLKLAAKPPRKKR